MMFKRLMAMIFGSALAISPAACAELAEGGLYATPQENGTYSVLKILKRDGHGVHVRVYSNVYETLPRQVDEATLYMAGADKKDNELLGMGHLPISNETFAGWGAVFIQQSTVKPDELEGYEYWREAQGGYF